MHLLGRVGLGVAAAGLLAVGCSEKKEVVDVAANQPPALEAKLEAAPTDAVTPELRKEASDIFASRCMPCHGPSGKGDGPASSGLTPPPANFALAGWQQGASDEHIEKIIQYGGAAVGKSPAMPPNPDLVDKPVVKALREHIRSFGK